MAEARGKKALPREASDGLGFAGVIEVLRILEGENVCLVILFADRPYPSRSGFKGRLVTATMHEGTGLESGTRNFC